jgi:hypothetical protein
VCSGIGHGLNAIVARPLDATGTEIRLPGPAAAGAGIGSDLILRPVTLSLAGAAGFCEIVGVVVGVATGFRPLALVAGTMLARDGFHQVLARGIGEGARTLDGRAGAPEITTTPDRDLSPHRDPGPS